jgi:hypothetical protein
MIVAGVRKEVKKSAPKKKAPKQAGGVEKEGGETVALGAVRGVGSAESGVCSELLG